MSSYPEKSDDIKAMDNTKFLMSWKIISMLFIFNICSLSTVRYLKKLDRHWCELPCFPSRQFSYLQRSPRVKALFPPLSKIKTQNIPHLLQKMAQDHGQFPLLSCMSDCTSHFYHPASGAAHSAALVKTESLCYWAQSRVSLVKCADGIVLYTPWSPGADF